MQLFYIGAVGRFIRLEIDFFGCLVINGINANIFRDIHQHRSRATGTGDQKSFLDNPGKIFGTLNQVVVFGARSGDAHGIDFLKGVISDQMCRDLPRKYDHRNGIHIGGCDTADRVGGAGPGGNQAYAHPASGTGIPIGSMNRTRLLANQNMTDIRSFKFIINVDDRPTRISEDRINTFFF